MSDKAIWRHGKKMLTGRWRYVWHRYVFLIQLDGRDPETGLERQPFEVHGEQPEFGKFKLVENVITTGDNHE